MRVFIKNCCRCVISFQIQGEAVIYLKPSQTISLQRADFNNVNLTISHTRESFVRKFPRQYNLLIESEYLITDVKEDEIFRITREKIQVDIGVIYDRLFLLASNSRVSEKKHTILNIHSILKTYKRFRILDICLLNPIEYSTGMVFMLLILGIILSFFLNWKYTLIYWILSYLFVVLNTIVVNKFFRFIDEKVFKEDTTFNDYLDGEYIKNYYESPVRKPAGGKIHIEDDRCT